MKSAMNNNSTFRTLNVRPPLTNPPTTAPTDVTVSPTVTPTTTPTPPPFTLTGFELHGSGIDKLNTVVRSFSVPDVRRLNVDV